MKLWSFANPLCLTIGVAALVACRAPESVRRIQSSQQPLNLQLSLHPALPDRALRQEIYEQEIRAKLGGLVALEPANTPITPATPVLGVEVGARLADGKTVVGAAGVGGFFAGESWGTAHGLGSGKSFGKSLGEGFVTGVAFSVFTTTGEWGRVAYHRQRLGFKPLFVTCGIYLQPRSSDLPLVLHDHDTWEVVKTMQPPPVEPKGDTKNQIRSEGVALAQVVAVELENKGWKRGR